ncbi:MAG: PilZ domain-containing protein [Archangium sp.]
MLPHMLIEQPKRASRVQFKHPVRVETLSEPKRVIRTLTANVSRDGLFLRMPEPLPPGTKLNVALEAAGSPHSLAEGEVCWGTTQGELAGCGVRFTKYTHPRSKELLSHLVDSIQHNRPLRVAGRRARWRRLIPVAVVALLLLTATVFAFGEATPPAREFETAATPVVVAAPVALVVPEAPPVADEVKVESPVVVAAVPAPAPVAKKTVLTSARVTKKAGEPSPALVAALKGAPAPVPAQRFGSSMSVAGNGRGSMALKDGASSKLSWDDTASTMRLTASGKVTKAFFLASPPRAVFDIEGEKPSHAQNVDMAAPYSKTLRVGELPKGTRLVIDLERAPKSAQAEGNSLVLSF